MRRSHPLRNAAPSVVGGPPQFAPPRHCVPVVIPILLLTGMLMAPTARAGVNVYITNSGNAVADTALTSLLTSFGHTVTLGVAFTSFDGTQNLTGINTVYFQPNYNWNLGDMPVAGQTTLLNFVNNGGGLVTAEWAVWNAASLTTFTTLAPLFPVVPTGTFDDAGIGNFSVTTANGTLDDGLPATFSTALESISGTETNFTTLRPGAVSYFENNGFIGAAGMNMGTGHVLSFNTVNAQTQVADPNFGRLLSNSMNWAAGVSIVSAAPEPGTLCFLTTGIVLVAGTIVRRRNACT